MFFFVYQKKNYSQYLRIHRHTLEIRQPDATTTGTTTTLMMTNARKRQQQLRVTMDRQECRNGDNRTRYEVQLYEGIEGNDSLGGGSRRRCLEPSE